MGRLCSRERLARGACDLVKAIAVCMNRREPLVGVVHITFRTALIDEKVARSFLLAL
jgi:hypothetical protein